MDRPALFVLFGLVLLFVPGRAKDAAPKVQIYTRAPGHYDEENILICHASGFYPPELELQLLHDGKVMEGTNQSDLAFEEDWFYHLTRHAHFTPTKGHQYSCGVTHRGHTKTYHWEADV
ncbi:beta-2-microglobulin-like [Eucyclogobius newberryi]|uniref:beta-2-microglobulin-like n=1 Tax=Eucyclogobius newberryi TaxID=166745 RepID=UPI003B5AD76A